MTDQMPFHKTVKHKSQRKRKDKKHCTATSPPGRRLFENRKHYLIIIEHCRSIITTILLISAHHYRTAAVGKEASPLSPAKK